jgi:hypothetical protein
MPLARISATQYGKQNIMPKLKTWKPHTQVIDKKGFLTTPE